MVVAAVAASTVGAAVAEPESSPTSYTAADCVPEALELPDDASMSIVGGVDSTGEIAVGRAYPPEPDSNFDRTAIVWRDGVMEEVDMPGMEQMLRAVNGSAVAVGSVYDGGQVPYYYADGEAAQLPGVDRGDATDVNESGAAVGYSADGDAEAPVLWPDVESEPVELELPDEAEGGRANVVDDDGSVAGFYRDDSGNRIHYQWDPDGEGSELPLPADFDPEEADGYVKAVADGWIVGLVWLEGLAAVQTVRWSPDGEAEALDLNGVDGVNADGLAVGSVLYDAAVQGDGEPETLPGLIDDVDGLGDWATGVSADGSTVVGQSTFDADPADGTGIAATVWSCE